MTRWLFDDAPHGVGDSEGVRMRSASLLWLHPRIFIDPERFCAIKRGLIPREASEGAECDARSSLRRLPWRRRLLPGRAVRGPRSPIVARIWMHRTQQWSRLIFIQWQREWQEWPERGEQSGPKPLNAPLQRSRRPRSGALSRPACRARGSSGASTSSACVGAARGRRQRRGASGDVERTPRNSCSAGARDHR